MGRAVLIATVSPPIRNVWIKPVVLIFTMLCHDAGVRSAYSRILSAGPTVNALLTHVFVYEMCLYLYLRMRTSAYDLMKASAYRLNAGLYIKRMHLLRVSTRRPLSY